MSPVIYFLADLYPWWGIPLGLILIELGNRYRRHGNKPKFIRYMAIGVVLLAIAVVYFVFNGVEKTRPALQELENSFSNKK